MAREMHVSILSSCIVGSRFELSLASGIVIGEVTTIHSMDYGTMWISNGEIEFFQELAGNTGLLPMRRQRVLHVDRFWISFRYTLKSTYDFAVLASLFEDYNLLSIELGSTNANPNYVTEEKLLTMAYEPEQFNVTDDPNNQVPVVGDVILIILEYSADAWIYISQGGINIGG